MVLIETSWNVKLHTITTSPGHFGVLIETSWNVKNIEYVFEGGRGGLY